MRNQWMVGVVSVGLTLLLPQALPAGPKAEHALRSAASAQELDPAFPVAPALELDQWVHEYRRSPEGETSPQLKESEGQWLQYKKSGKVLWNSREWMKEPGHYRSLDTRKLAQECFERPILYHELAIFDDPAFGLQRVRIMHYGFAEFFSRADMWEGILLVFEQASATVADPQSDLKQIVHAAKTIEALCTLCRLSPLREQIKGNNEAFLDALVVVLKRFKASLDGHDATRTSDSIGFFREPCTAANMCLVFLREIDPRKYESMVPRVQRVRFSEKQSAEDLRAYLGMIITDLDTPATATSSGNRPAAEQPAQDGAP